MPAHACMLHLYQSCRQKKMISESYALMHHAAIPRSSQVEADLADHVQLLCPNRPFRFLSVSRP
jgi:hypothetical protein